MKSVLCILRQYPKLLCMVLSCALAYVLFRMGMFDSLHDMVGGRGYISVFLAGLLFSMGFTTPFAIAMFAAMADTVHPLPAAAVGGLGALLADMGLFEVARVSMHDELYRLRRTRWISALARLFQRPRFSKRIRLYFLWCVAGIIIASPLPDELGVTLLGGTSAIDAKKFAALCFLLNTMGILAILLTARAATS